MIVDKASDGNAEIDMTGGKTVLVTGANGYIGNAVAKAFSRAGWKTYGLIRKPKDAADLAMDEIHPVVGSPEDLAFLEQTDGAVFDVVVSNTEDRKDPAVHLQKVRLMVDEVVRRSQKGGVRPFIMFSSGCKDYGMMSQKHGDAGLAPHTESSPMNPPAQLAARKDFGIALLADSGDAYDATVLRPTIVYGHSSSHYGSLFELAAESKSVLRLAADPNAIMHSLHVDDCADAYVALAEHPKRNEIAGEAFNISNTMYETAQQVGEALAKSCGLTVEFVTPVEKTTAQAVHSSAHSLANFWQWVGSDKIRRVTGWTERKTTFTDGIDEYRLAYEATKRARG
jgi:nucleoside-diphosphate-sugar epimerase